MGRPWVFVMGPDPCSLIYAQSIATRGEGCNYFGPSLGRKNFVENPMATIRWATITAAALIPCMSHAFDGTLFGILPSGYRSSARATAPGLRRTRMASRESTGDEPFRSMDGQSDLRGGRDRTRNQQVTRHPNSYHFVVACTVAALAQTIFGSVHSRRCLL